MAECPSHPIHSAIPVVLSSPFSPWSHFTYFPCMFDLLSFVSRSSVQICVFYSQINSSYFSTALMNIIYPTRVLLRYFKLIHHTRLFSFLIFQKLWAKQFFKTKNISKTIFFQWLTRTLPLISYNCWWLIADVIRRWSKMVIKFICLYLYCLHLYCNPNEEILFVNK